MQLKHETKNLTLIPCVSYLPPENSSRRVDVNSFFDTWLPNIYRYQTLGNIFICGDVNGLCGDLEDFISGVDAIGHRDVVDFKTNFYGEVLIEFLINTNMFILNDRNYLRNDFTSVSMKGLSVVDYCLVSHDALSAFSSFDVIRTVELINRVNDINSLAPSSIPNHSVISWKMNFDNFINTCTQNEECLNTTSYDKFDVSNVPYTFLSNKNVLHLVNETIIVLESTLRTQTDVDVAYDNWCGLVRDQMYNTLPYQTVKSGTRNKKRKMAKPWWHEGLTGLWNRVCDTERAWLNCRNKSEKSKLKSDYVTITKEFDRQAQHAKRLYWFNFQNKLITDGNYDTANFWKAVGKVGVGQNQKQRIPMEVVLDNGSVACDTASVLNKWKHDFNSLLNCQQGNNLQQNRFGNGTACQNNAATLDPLFNDHISIFEMKKALDNSKRGKACGFDAIPVDVLFNDTSASFLHVLFNICFEKGIIPSSWNKCIINPIPKSSTNDPRDPMSYRGIALASSMYKLYCSVLNTRISSWCEENDKIVDEQNGFRKSRSTSDHISTLTNIVETRKKRKLSTYCAFIDFRKAYDCISRDLLWGKLEEIGIAGKLLTAVKSSYASVSSCVRINDLTTDWFDVACGLRQGCSLTPLLFNMFNLFINDLALQVKALGKGVPVDDQLISILLYADDVVLIGGNAHDLQCMLDILNDWCGANRISVNASKSNVVHFRPNSVARTSFEFKCGATSILTADKYTYLGITLNEFLDFNITTKTVAQNASRALGLLIAKYKCIGGMPYHVFSKLYDTLVWPVISYGASVWGTKSFSCINAVQNRAMRFFLVPANIHPQPLCLGIWVGHLPLLNSGNVSAINGTERYIWMSGA